MSDLFLFQKLELRFLESASRSRWTPKASFVDPVVPDFLDLQRIDVDEFE